MAGNVRISTENMKHLRSAKVETGASFEFLVNKAVSAAYSIPSEPNDPSVEDLVARAPQVVTAKVVSSKVTVAPDDLRFSEWAWGVMDETMENVKKPNLDSWAKVVRLMRTADSRSYEDMTRVWQWVRQDSFWKSNVMGMSKFRQKFDTLNDRSKAPASSGSYTAAKEEKADKRSKDLKDFFSRGNGGEVIEHDSI